jgi:hypothetical protein
LTLGAPAKKEVYKMIVTSQTAPTGNPFSYTMVTLLFDSSDALVAGAGSPLLTDSLGIPTDALMIRGTFTCNSFSSSNSTAVNPADFANNGDGTYTMTFRSGTLGSGPLTELKLDKFKRTTDTGGTLTYKVYTNSLSNLTGNYTGTYDSTRIQ